MKFVHTGSGPRFGASFVYLHFVGKPPYAHPLFLKSLKNASSTIVVLSCRQCEGLVSGTFR